MTYSLFICSAYDLANHPHYFRADAIYSALKMNGPVKVISVSSQGRFEESTSNIKVPTLWNSLTALLIYLKAPKFFYSLLFKLFFSITPLDHESDFALTSSIAALYLFFKFGKPSCIVSSSGSVSAHLCGFLMSKLLSINHIRDDGDPWSFNPLVPFAYRINKFFSRPLDLLIASHCTTLLVTTRSYQYLLKKRCTTKNRIFHVPCGYNENITMRTDDSNLDAQTTSSNKTIRYLGSLPKHREFSNASIALNNFVSDYALACNHEPQSITLEFYGNVSNKFISSLAADCPFVDSLPKSVSRSKAQLLTCTSDVLLLAGNRSSLQIPGKLYEYLASSSLILYIQNHPHDECLDILNEFGGFIAIKQDRYLGDSTLIQKQLDLASKRQYNPKIKQYSWHELSQRFSNIFRECTVLG